MPGLRGFELPEDDSSIRPSTAEERTHNVSAPTPIRQVFQSDGQNAIWRFESSQPSQAVRLPRFLLTARARLVDPALRRYALAGGGMNIVDDRHGYRPAGTER